MDPATGPDGHERPEGPGAERAATFRGGASTPNVKREDTLSFPAGKYPPNGARLVRQEFTSVDVESSKANTKLAFVTRRLRGFVCRHTTHDWFALAYPPARRWECLRCGVIVEEPSTVVPAPRPAPRVATKRGDRHSRD